MKESEVKTTKDLLEYLNTCPFEAVLELDKAEFDCACRIKDIGLNWEDEINHLEIELIHIDYMEPSRFTLDTQGTVIAKMLQAWSVKDEAQCQVQNVLDVIQEQTGYRGDLYSWLEDNDNHAAAIERRAAEVDFHYDAMKEAM